MRKLAIILLVAVLAACEKDEFPENGIIGTPAFINEVSFNGTDYTLSAGLSGLVMQPTFVETDSTVEFTSVLSDPACAECGPALRVRLNSPPSFVPTPSPGWIGVLQSWDYVLDIETEAPGEILQLTASNGNNFSEGHWFLNGAQISTTESGAIDFVLEQAGTYELNFSDSDSVCLQGGGLVIEYNGTDIPCYGSISQDMGNTNLFVAEPGPAFGTTDISYTWIVDGNVLAGPSDIIVLVNATSITEICVVMQGSLGCTDSICYVPPQSAAALCANNLKIQSSEFIPVGPEPFDLSLITIAFTDPNGSVYSSVGNQENAAIQLLSIEAYQEPARPGEAFAAFEMQVSCTLYDQNGQGFPFSGLVNMAWALP